MSTRPGGATKPPPIISVTPAVDAGGEPSDAHESSGRLRAALGRVLAVMLAEATPLARLAQALLAFDLGTAAHDAQALLLELSTQTDDTELACVATEVLTQVAVRGQDAKLLEWCGRQARRVPVGTLPIQIAEAWWFGHGQPATALGAVAGTPYETAADVLDLALSTPEFAGAMELRLVRCLHHPRAQPMQLANWLARACNYPPHIDPGEFAHLVVRALERARTARRDLGHWLQAIEAGLDVVTLLAPPASDARQQILLLRAEMLERMRPAGAAPDAVSFFMHLANASGRTGPEDPARKLLALAEASTVSFGLLAREAARFAAARANQLELLARAHQELAEQAECVTVTTTHARRAADLLMAVPHRRRDAASLYRAATSKDGKGPLPLGYLQHLLQAKERDALRLLETHTGAAPRWAAWTYLTLDPGKAAESWHRCAVEAPAHAAWSWLLAAELSRTANDRSRLATIYDQLASHALAPPSVRESQQEITDDVDGVAPVRTHAGPRLAAIWRGAQAWTQLLRHRPRAALETAELALSHEPRLVYLQALRCEAAVLAGATDNGIDAGWQALLANLPTPTLQALYQKQYALALMKSEAPARLSRAMQLLEHLLAEAPDDGELLVAMTSLGEQLGQAAAVVSASAATMPSATEAAAPASADIVAPGQPGPATPKPTAHAAEATAAHLAAALGTPAPSLEAGAATHASRPETPPASEFEPSNERDAIPHLIADPVPRPETPYDGVNQTAEHHPVTAPPINATIPPPLRAAPRGTQPPPLPGPRPIPRIPAPVASGDAEDTTTEEAGRASAVETVPGLPPPEVTSTVDAAPPPSPPPNAPDVPTGPDLTAAAADCQALAQAGKFREAIALAEASMYQAQGEAKLDWMRRLMEFYLAQGVELEKACDLGFAIISHELPRQPSSATSPRLREAMELIIEPARQLERWQELEVALQAMPLTEYRDTRAALDAVRQAQAPRGELTPIPTPDLHRPPAVPPSLPSPVQRAQALASLTAAEAWEELATTLERWLPQLPADDLASHVGLLLHLGELRASKLDKPLEAAQAFESVLMLDPEHATALGYLEELYSQLGRDRELGRIVETRAQLAASPEERAQRYAQLGAMRTSRHDYDGAIEALLAAITAQPADREIFTALEKVCYRHQRWPEAARLYEIATNYVRQGNPRAYRLADLLVRQGQLHAQHLNNLELALDHFSEALVLDAAPQAASAGLEAIAARTGDYLPLCHAYARRAELAASPESRIEALQQAAAYARKGEHAAEYLATAQQLFTLEACDGAMLQALDDHYVATNQHEALRSVLEARLANAASDAQALDWLKRLAKLHEDGMHDVQVARGYYQRMYALAPSNREALEGLARLYEVTKDWPAYLEATEALIKVVTEPTALALLHFRCGSVREAKCGDEQGAVAAYQAALAASGACLPALHGLREYYVRQAQWPEVVATLEQELQAWAEDKDQAGVYAQLGQIYDQHLHDSERAVRYYESALEVDPDCLPANVAVFEHALAVGDWLRAKNASELLIERAVRDGDPSYRSDFYRKRGLALRMLGEYANAAESLVTAMEIKPANLDALEDLAALSRAHPSVFDFEATWRELEKLYRRRGDAQPLLARVLIAAATIVERDGDLEASSRMHAEATQLAPHDQTIVEANVRFHVQLRDWNAAAAEFETLLASETLPAEARHQTMLRLAQLFSEGPMDHDRAAATLARLLELAPNLVEGHYQLAQTELLRGRHLQAEAAIDRVIALATAADQELQPTVLARYYYYKGRIASLRGEPKQAHANYRRAIEYDPGYAPPALLLAHGAYGVGDQAHAEALLIETAHAAMAEGGPIAAVPLQRGLARMLVASGDRRAAIEAYRGILNVDPENANDRVALAEIYAVEDVPKAIKELRKLFDQNIHHGPAYRLLGSLYQRAGEVERTHRVMTALELLGFAEDSDQLTRARLRASRAHVAIRRPLSDEMRTRWMLSNRRTAFDQLFAAMHKELARWFIDPAQALPPMALPLAASDSLSPLATELVTMLGVVPAIYLAPNVPGYVMVTDGTEPRIILDATVAHEPASVQRFLLGWAMEALRGGYAFMLAMGNRSRREFGHLMRMLLQPKDDQPHAVRTLIDNATPRAQLLVEQYSQNPLDEDPLQWVDTMLASAKRCGLVTCDDFGAAIWAVARLAGEQPTDPGEILALGRVLGGQDLVNFYLSEDYHRLRHALTTTIT